MSAYHCSICKQVGHSARTCGRISKTDKPASARFTEGRRERTPEPVPMARVEQIETPVPVIEVTAFLGFEVSSSWLVTP